MTVRFVERPDSTDPVVVREIWDENVYHVARGDFAEGGIAVDIGANIGAFALYAAHCGARRVIAYEPEEGNYRALLANIANNPSVGGCIEPVRMAVWSHEGELAVEGRGGGCRVGPVSGASGPRVRARTLDQLFDVHDVDACDVLKLDVEGAEFPIFEGASSETLARCRRIVIEFHEGPAHLLGRLLTDLTRTHKFFVLGSVDRGGYIWAERY